MNANIEDTTGRLDLYSYHEVSILLQIADIRANEIFANFMNLKSIQHINRRGVELKNLSIRQKALNTANCFYASASGTVFSLLVLKGIWLYSKLNQSKRKNVI